MGALKRGAGKRGTAKRRPAKRRRPRRRPRKGVAIAVGVLILAAGAVYALVLRDDAVAPSVRLPTATATIGEGEDAIAVGARGELLPWLPLPEEARLPALPIDAAPDGGRLAGPVLEQARVLGAAPPALRPYIATTYYGDAGVDVVLRTGIELGFGDDSRREQKWKAAAAVLANPTITELDYVNLHAPRRPTVDGSGHTLPPLP